MSSPQLTVTAYLTDTVAAAGTHFSIVLDAKPSKGIHVYAPGVTSYTPIGLAVQPTPGLVVRDATFPASEPYVFKPLNERVPVYQRPFRIVQDPMIDPTPQGAAALKDQTALTIQGTLSYQACDAAVCFTPQTVPLTWTIALRQLDRERAPK